MSRLPKELHEIGENLRTQDNRATSIPIFIVQQRRRVYGVDSDYCSDHVWVDPDDGGEVDDEEIALLDAAGEDTGGWSKVGVLDHWEFVTACFTEVGCERYLAANGHNLTDPRIYVHTGHRNKEWEDVRDFLIDLCRGFEVMS